jgi:hypothetical protein
LPRFAESHDDGTILRYLGKPCSGESCPSWERLDNNPASRDIAVGGNHLYHVRRARQPHARLRGRCVRQRRLMRQDGTPDAHGAPEQAPRLFGRAGRDHPVALGSRADEDEPVARVPSAVAEQMHARDAHVGHLLLDEAPQVRFSCAARQAADVHLAVARLLAGVTHCVNEPFSRTRPSHLDSRRSRR